MIFSQNVIKSTEEKFNSLLSKAGKKQQEIISKIEEMQNCCDEDTVFAVKWIYAHSPMSDIANYDFEIFKNTAEHGVYLRKNSPFAKDVPEDIFLNYVLHIRVNEEDLCDCRKFFYDILKDRVENLSMHDAIIETNYWNAENVMYQLTDSRTISALGAYYSAYGRCGEESNFGVNVYRALGIPCRQIYTPRWAHCDDNHAWIEVYCEGKWYFLGACEPEEVLNKGWFTNASSRAMLIHSRCFGDISNEEVISKVGMTTFLNNLKLYAVTKHIVVKVVDENDAPIKDAQVSFGILNYSNIFSSAVLNTDENGEAGLTCGLGSLNIHVKKDDVYCEKMVFTPDVDEVKIVLKKEDIQKDSWMDFVCFAPKDQIVNGAKPTEEQKLICQKKTDAANAKREQRVAEMFDKEKAMAVVEKYSYSEEIYNILFESRSNVNNLIEFLQDENFTADEKEKLLLTLSKKDRRDVDIDILREALLFTKEYTFENEDIFYKYVVCPRAHFEPLTKYRQFICEFFTDEEKKEFRTNPALVWKYINDNIAFDESIEYGQIVTLPTGALTVKNASLRSKRILFVAICRTLGIPARMNPISQIAEYYSNDKFVTVEKIEKGNCTIIFEKEDDETWQYYPDFSIGHLEDEIYQTLELSNEKWEGNELEIKVIGGEYRVITDNRLPNGNLFASKYHFSVKDGETKRIKLRKYQANLSEMLDNFELDEFKVYDADGNVVLGSDITKNKAVLMWMEEGREPTEHLMNEMLDQADDFKNLSADIVVIIRDKSALENAKLKLVLKTFPRIKVYFDSFVPNVETIARRMYVDPDKLPLVIVTTKSLNAVYACSGYNVGSGDMIVKICSNFN